MSNDELQQLAEELARLDRSKDFGRAAVLEREIADFEFKKLKNWGGKAYFPLLKKYNGAIPIDDFTEIFIDVLMGLLRRYKPEKGPFAAALSYQLNNRVKDYFINLAKQNGMVYIDYVDQDGQTLEIPDPVDFTEGIGEDLKTEIRVFVRLAPLVEEQKKKDEHVAKKLWFERFYSFDLTKTVKNDPDCANEAVSVNDKIFPIMEVILLKFLMYGEFTEMRDVVDNIIKDVKMLDKRNETIQKCYNVSKPTVCVRNSSYFELLKQAVNA